MISNLPLRILLAISILSLAINTNLPTHQQPGAGGKLMPSTPCIIYVKANAPSGGNGLSWGTAYAKLQDGISRAAQIPCGEVWVAAGTYKPVETSRLTWFYLLNGVGVYGGFTGTESARINRNIQNNPTILSGDIMIAGDDRDNAYNVVYVNGGVDATAILDGFTITGGNANGTASGFIYGGGIEIENGSPTLSNLTITGNKATEFGGGIYISNGSPNITNVSIISNSATSGAGIYVTNGSPHMTQITFDSNVATDGGALYITNQSNPILELSNFYNNVATHYGGGVYNSGIGGGLSMANDLFDGNHAQSWGGGMYTTQSHVNMSRVDFAYNHAPFGAGMGIDEDTSSSLTNCTFTGNEATERGGGMYAYGGYFTMTNVFLAKNTAMSTGGSNTGGAISGYGSSPTLTNITFYGNTALYGGGFYNTNGGHPLIRNSILWGDSGGEIYNDPTFPAGTTSTTYSLAQGCNPSGTWNTSACGASGGHNLVDADPQFVSLNGNNFRLQITSPAIDRGNNAYVNNVPWDMDNNARILSRVVDLGPYETRYYPRFLSQIKH